MHTREAYVPEGFIYYHGDGIGKVQGPCLIYHGYPDAVFPIAFQKRLGQPGCFLAEYQEAVFFVFRFSIVPLTLGGRIVEKPVRILQLQFIKAVIVSDIYKMPIIKPCTLQIPVVHGKAQGPDQVQIAAGCGTGSGYISGILGNFGFYQYNIDTQANNS